MLITFANSLDIDQTPGEYSYFFRIRRLGPSIYRSPQKISGISSTPKKYLYRPKKIYQFCTLTLKKETLNCREMTLKLTLILWWPQKNIHKIFIPPKNNHFSENQKKYWNSEFWTQKKWAEPTYAGKYQSTLGIRPDKTSGFGVFLKDFFKVQFRKKDSRRADDQDMCTKS